VAVFDTAYRIQRSAKTACGFGIAVLLTSCSQDSYHSDNYDPQTFYNANDISFSTDTEELKKIEGHSILFSINSESQKIEISEKCTKVEDSLTQSIPTVNNILGEKCSNKYLVSRRSADDFCFHIRKRKMRNEFDDYERIFSDTVGFVTIDGEGDYHITVVNTDNDDEIFFTYFSVEKISVISCDVFK